MGSQGQPGADRGGMFLEVNSIVYRSTAALSLCVTVYPVSPFRQCLCRNCPSKWSPSSWYQKGLFTPRDPTGCFCCTNVPPLLYSFSVGGSANVRSCALSARPVCSRCGGTCSLPSLQPAWCVALTSRAGYQVS